MVLTYLYKSELLNRRRLFTILLSENNKHFDIIDELRRNDLLFEHRASTEQAPIYVLDRVLLKTDFRGKLTEIIGRNYLEFEQIPKGILKI